MVKWPKPKPTPEEEYIAKLNEEAKARELHPPAPSYFDFSQINTAGMITGGQIRTERISAGSIKAVPLTENFIKCNTIDPKDYLR